MNVEENRLRTFTDWPANAPVDPNRIAKAGFYYSGHALEVQCFLCGVKISEWNYGDKAIVRHSLAEPNCPFIQNPSETCNVPLVPVSANNHEFLSSSTEISQEDNVYESLSVEEVTVAYSNTESQKDYRTMSERLQSFVNWPLSCTVSAEKLAKAGFYYLQHDDNVKCAYCGGILREWSPNDDPAEEHRKHFPNCDFSIHQDKDDSVSLNVKLLPGTTSSTGELGIVCHETTRKPQYSTFERRLRTFNNWSKHFKQTPEMLASAGFYYTGTDDSVMCYYCEGALRNWEATDDAWTEHARWFPKCKFVNLMRGQEFIKQCIDNRPPLDDSIFEGVPVNDENDVASSGNSSSSTVAFPPTDVQSSTEAREEELEILFRSFPARLALDLGLNEGRVKLALKKRMEEVGTGYSDPNQLIGDVLSSQVEEDTTSLQEEIHESLSTELLISLNNLESKEHSNSSEKQHSDAVKDATPSDKKATVNFIEASFLEEENRKLKEARTCKICMDSEICIVFLPCGHLASCVPCALSLKYCPMCRKEIRANVRAFFS